MILHIADDEKFIDYAIDQFEEVYPSNNIFLIIVPHDNYTPRFVKNTDKIKVVVKGSRNYKRWINTFDQYDLVLFHNLILPYKNDLVLNAPSTVSLALIIWGREMYDKLYYFRNKLLQSETKKLVKDLKLPIKLKLKRTGREILDYLQKEIINKPKKNERAFQRLDYIGIFVKEDYDLLNSVLPLNAKWFSFNYYSIEDITHHQSSQQVLGNNILIGNSSSATNNHIEAFHKLSKISLNDRKVIVPMSYGDPYYRKEILKEGQQILGDNFLPLIDFLTLEEYNKYLFSCGFVIMNHNRQQAVGNILGSLWFGAKVFLNEQNTLYNYFKRNKLRIFSISHDLNDRELQTKLSQSDIDQNRSFTGREFSRENNLHNLSQFLNSIKTN